MSKKIASLSRGNSSVSDHNANTVVKRTHCHREKIKGVTCVVQYLVAYLSSYHEKAVNTLCELAFKLPSVCLPYQDGGIPPSVFHNDTTSTCCVVGKDTWRACSSRPFTAERQTGKL